MIPRTCHNSSATGVIFCDVALNDRSAKIVHFVVDAATAALIDWIPCVAEDCPGIMPGESLIIPADDIVGFGESDQVIVYWWHVYKAPTGEPYRGETRAVIVKYS